MEKNKNISVIGVIDPDGFVTANRVISPDGVAPTILARDYKDPIKICVKRKNINRSN